MDRNELLKMLDLKAKPAPKPTEKLPIIGFDKASKDGSFTAKQTYSTTALVCDDWDIDKGETLHARTTLENVDANTMIDFHAAAFQGEPTLTEFACIDSRRYEFVKTLLETPEYKSLHSSTMYDEFASEIAAKKFATEFSTLKKEDEKRESKSGTPSKKESDKEMSCLMGVGKAVSEAQKEVDEYLDMTHAFGMGGNGGHDNKLDGSKVATLFERIKNNPQLRRIVDLAGRFRLMAQGKQRQKVSHGYEDMIGICLDDLPERLLSEELATLLDEDMELDTMRRLVEKETLAFDYKGTEKVGKGPIIIIVDESGSMHGEKVCTAKAFALAMAWIARHQGRWCGLVGFSGNTEGTLLVLPPHKWDENALADWLEHFYSGGSSRDVPIVELPEYFERMKSPKGKTDVLMVTDAACCLSDRIEKTFNEWRKKEKVRVISLVLHGGGETLENVSDEVHNIDRIGTDVEAVEKCLSI